MEHQGSLIATIALGLSAAFAAGFAARRIGVPPIVGYLLAGVALGPFTPGLFGDPGIATELAEIGVILLMFGVGIHFSFRDLLRVWRVAVPGAIGQITVATLLGIGLGLVLGWGLAGGLVLGQVARYTLRRFGVSSNEVEVIAQGLRRRSEGAGTA
jgi:monovalent cation:H+ antiporter-2, CPA2 family